MLHHSIIAAPRRLWQRLRYRADPPWLRPGAVSLWMYTPDHSKIDLSKERPLSHPLIVLAWAWSAGRVQGISVETPHYWVHADNRLDDYHACEDMLGIVDSNERFAQHIESGHLQFLGLIPPAAVPAHTADAWHMPPEQEDTPQPIALHAA